MCHVASLRVSEFVMYGGESSLMLCSPLYVAAMID